MANNNALLKLTEERIDSNEALQTFVEQAKAVTIPLFPETVQFTDSALKYGAALVTVDTKLDTYGNNRDIYKNESGGYCLHLSKLNEIAQQSGIIITDSRILERKTDEQGRVVFISHQVRGKLRSIDGSIKEDVATGKYDYFRDKEKYSKEGQIKSRRTHAEALAESNAKTRLFNKLVAKLPTSFTIDELKKPFLIPYVLEDKDELLKGLPKEDQLAIKRDLARKRLGLADTIYGYNSAPSQQKQIEDAAVTVMEEEEPKKNNLGISTEEENHILAEEFRDADQKERTEKILGLIELKGYQDPTNVPFTAQRIEKNSLDTQIKFIEKLLNLPDLVEELK
ncbi:MAG: hypothetical protein PHX51_07255 [Clostridia bacterium]|nr:hypothetical protein [Clostridia bacterium]